MPIVTKEHKGARVLFADCTNLNSDKCIAMLDELANAVLAAPDKSRVVSNYRNAALGPEFMSRAKTLGVKMQPRMAKQAIVGVDGVKMILLKAYVKVTGADIKVCQTEAEALDYVAS